MKNKAVFTGIFISFCLSLCMLIGCDPIYPPGNLKVEKIEPISQGESVSIDIIYPDPGLLEIDWKDQKVEIIDGDKIVAVSGLTLTGIKAGTATIKVSATTDIPEEVKSEHEERVYSTEVKIVVK